MSETERKPIGWVYERHQWNVGWRWAVSYGRPADHLSRRNITPIYPPAPKLSPEAAAAQRKAVADVLRILDGYPTAGDRDGVPMAFGELRDLVGRPRIGEREPRYDFVHTAPDGQQYVDANVELVAKVLRANSNPDGFPWRDIPETWRELWREKARKALNRVSDKR